MVDPVRDPRRDRRQHRRRHHRVQIFSIIVSLGLLLPNLSVAIRRLHDTDRTGWWILIGLIPLIGLIVLLIFYVRRATAGDNQYGPPMAEGVA